MARRYAFVVTLVETPFDGEVCRPVAVFDRREDAEDFADNREAIESGFGEGSVVEVHRAPKFGDRVQNPVVLAPGTGLKKRLMR